MISSIFNFLKKISPESSYLSLMILIVFFLSLMIKKKSYKVLLTEPILVWPVLFGIH